MDHFFTKIAGVSRVNADGTRRQASAARCQVGEQLVLEPEPDNPHDVNAMKLRRAAGEQLGYLPAEVAADVASRMRRRWQFVPFVAGVGRVAGIPRTIGVAVLLVITDGDADPEAIRAYAGRVLAEEAEQQPSPSRSSSAVSWILTVMAIAIAAMLLIAILRGMR